MSMRVFKDVGLVEYLGSGMGRILKAYDNSVFTFEDDFLIVTFPFEDGFIVPPDTVNDMHSAINDENGTVSEMDDTVNDTVKPPSTSAQILQMIKTIISL